MAKGITAVSEQLLNQVLEATSAIYHKTFDPAFDRLLKDGVIPVRTKK